MPRVPKPWWRASVGAWYTSMGGKTRMLAKGKKNKALANERFERLKEELKLARCGELHTLSVAALAEQYLDFVFHHRERSTYELQKRSLQQAVDRFGECYARNLTAAVVDQWTGQMKDAGLSNTSISIRLKTLVTCFNWAVRKEILTSHQLKNIERPRAQRRTRYLSDAEFNSLLRATNSQQFFSSRMQMKKVCSSAALFRQVLIALDQTAARPSEICRMQWEHVHWDNHIVVLPYHKTSNTRKIGGPRIIPMTTTFEKLLRWRQKYGPSTGYCFTNLHGNAWNKDSLGHRLRRIRESAGLKDDVVVYTIRHRAATKLVSSTGDLKSTSMVLGHETTLVTETYLHLTSQHLVDFVRRR